MKYIIVFTFASDIFLYYRNKKNIHYLPYILKLTVHINTFYGSDVNKPVSIQVRIICIEYQQISNIQFDFTRP